MARDFRVIFAEIRAQDSPKRGIPMNGPPCRDVWGRCYASAAVASARPRPGRGLRGLGRGFDTCWSPQPIR